MWLRSVAVVAALLLASTASVASTASASHLDEVATRPGSSVDPAAATPDRVEVASLESGRLPAVVRPLEPFPPSPDGSAPWGLVAYPTPDGVRLDWMAPLEGEPDGYNVYRSTDGDEPVLLAHVQETEYTDPVVHGDKVRPFVYHVTAAYGPQESAASNQAVAVTGPLSCVAFHVYPDVDGNRTPPVDYGVNEHYVDCVLRSIDARG